ncbi:hypothetical protein P43SY_003015 [Pythium insidiosum]|uniref:EF-hand domain-containing protein n=1 Tax=Pythium insidiosum TaxID=114742 RepID=A0AAD5Q638_PYTIN|nr:hypothetical protein P43SY_003015 [Pythium insidiosum]
MAFRNVVQRSVSCSQMYAKRRTLHRASRSIAPGHRVLLQCHDQSQCERTKETVLRLVETVQKNPSDSTSPSVILAKKALRYRRMLERAKQVDLDDPSMVVEQLLLEMPGQTQIVGPKDGTPTLRNECDGPTKQQRKSLEMKVRYGSQNEDEENAFIRRVVAPPKRNERTNKRRQKRVAAAIGASVVLVAAGAVATYVSLSGDSVPTLTTTPQILESATKDGFIIPDEEEDNGPGMDLPPFSEYDTNGDGILTQDEYVARLAELRDGALAKVERAHIPSDEKDFISGRLHRNFDSEAGCVMRLAARHRANNGQLKKERFPLFYSMVKEFCIIEDVRIPEEYRPTEIPAKPENQEAPPIDEEPTLAPRPHPHPEPEPTYAPEPEPHPHPEPEPTYAPEPEPTTIEAISPLSVIETD